MFSKLQHLFLPRHSNNHRAKALHVEAMFVYALAFLAFNLLTRNISSVHPDILGYATNIQVQQLLAESNTKRLAAGLQPLQLSQELSQAAAGKAADMFGNNYWAHVSPAGKTPWDFIIGAGYRYSVAGENLAKNFQDSTGVVDAWMNSPTHKENLLKSSYREVGFAVVNGVLQGEETTLVVQMFGTRPNARVVEAAEPSPIAQVTQAPAQATEEVPSLAVVTEPNEVVISEVASVTESLPVGNFLSAFNGVSITPMFDIVTLRRDVSLLFGGIFVGVMLVDMYLAMKKRSVRAVGSTVAHVLFFVAIMISLNFVTRGSLI